METDYGENVVADLREARLDWKGGTDPLLSRWSHDAIHALLVEVETAVESMESLVDLVPFSLSLGSLSRKLDLTGSDATISTIRHTIGLLHYALKMSERGGIIHAIEGSSESREQIMGDLDLLYTFNGKVYAADYTNIPTPRPGYLVLPPSTSKLVESKYNKLRSAYKDWSHEVICYGSCPVLRLQLKPSVYRGCPREDDFASADRVSTFLRALPLNKAEDLLNSFTQHCEQFKQDKRDMVVSPSNAPMNHIGRMAVHNNPMVGKLYKEFRSQLSESSLERHFSGSWYETWADSEVKSSFKLPVYPRQTTIMCPFKRLGAIAERFFQNQLLPHPLIKALSLLSTESHAEFEMEQGTFRVERVTKDGQPFNAVKLYMPGFSLSQWRDLQKTLIPSECYKGDLEDMETVFQKMDDDWMSEGPGGADLNVVEMMTRAVMPDGDFSEEVRKIMLAQLDTIKDTKVASWMSQKQELSRALLSVPRKRQSLKSHKLGGFFQDNITLSLDCVSDRFAVVLSGLGPTTFGASSHWNYFVLGAGRKAVGSLGDYRGMSRILSASMAQLDWDSVILARSLSYYTLTSEMRIATHGRKLADAHERSFPMMLMNQNNNKFAQASEMVRYIFVNCTGLCGSPKALLNKIGWFLPTTFTQKLYMLRLCKMMDVLQAHKCHNALHQLRLKHEGLVSTKEGGFIRRVSEYWNVAMPNELVPSESDHSLFNSFYVCRAMTMQRYNKTVSEALVLEKQLDSREEYLSVKHEHLKHELRFMEEYDTLDEFIEDMTHLSSEGYGPWSASWRAQAHSVLATCMKLRTDEDTTVGSVFDRVHNLQGVMMQLGITQVMNSRGSVLSTSKTGLVISSRVKDNHGKIKSTTQNSKCWRTLLLALQDIVEGKAPPQADYYAQAERVMDEVDLDLAKVSKCNDSLAPMILWATQLFAFCVSKMVHKDQIGAREIAVLNAWARVMCYYVESLSRRVRDDEHDRKLRVNLIERSDKEKIVEDMLMKGKANKAKGLTVMFDSADCSKWGPSMMPSTLYLTLACRMNNHNHKMVLRNCLSLFGTKVFKIPDHFFMKVTHNPDGKDKTNDVMSRLLSMSTEMGSYKDQYIRLEESMHQGILGVTSSVMGSDAQNLSNYVLEKMFQEDNMQVKSHITSDDYCRLIMWKSETGYFKMAKESLAVHNDILLMLGIKRNLQKSALSNNYMEFNSVYHTYSGSFRPDVKQRLSFVDYGQSPDSEPNALRVMNMSAEYMRNDGGLIGSCWISVLNNSLLYHQNQLEKLYSQIGLMIYHIPLELGGLVRTDPIRHVVGPPIMSLCPNYSRDGSLTEAYNQMWSHAPEELTEMSAYMLDDTLKVASMSRSGVVRLSTRPKRASRAIREYLLSQPDSYFEDLITGRSFNSLKRGLIACAHRETSTESTMGSGLRLANCMHVHSQKVFKINCAAYGDTRLLSRTEIDHLAINWASGVLPEVAERAIMIDLNKISKIMDDLDKYCQNMRIVDITWFPRMMHKEPLNMDLAPSFFVDNTLSDFDCKYSPLTSDVKPWDYLECREVLKSKLRKLSRVRSNILMALMLGEDIGTSLQRRLLMSNFLGGCRVMLEGVEQVHLLRNMDETIKLSLIAMSNPNYKDSGRIMQFSSPRYPAMMRSGLVSKTDITGLLNMLQGDSSYDFGNHELKFQILQSLYQCMKLNPDRFTVNVRRLTGNFQPVEYASSRLVHIQQRALKGTDHETIGREFIVKRKGKWEHRCFITERGIAFPLNNATDTYLVEDLSDCDYMNVKITEDFGCFFISLLSGQYIQYLSQSLMKPTKVLLKCKMPLEKQLETLIDLGIRDVRLMDLIEFRDIFEQSAGYYQTVREEHEMMDSDSDSDYLDDSGDEEMYEAGMSGLADIMALVAATGPSKAPLAPLFDAKSGSDDDSEVDEDEVDLDLVAPISESQASRPFALINKMMTSSNLVDITEKVRKRFKLTGSESVYEMEVPVELSVTKYADDDQRSAFEKLFTQLSTMSEAESDWLKGYVLESISHNPFVKAAFIQRDAILASADVEEEQEDKEDDEWN